MSAHSRVIWSEGLFLQPQHFQQQDRYFERYVENRCQALNTHSWGLTEIELERDFLAIGKFGLRRSAAPASSKWTAMQGRTRWCATMFESCRRATRRPAGETRRCWRSGRCGH